MLIFVTGSATVRSVRNWVRHWNTEVYAGTNGPMALRVVMFLEVSPVEQRVCFVFI